MTGYHALSGLVAFWVVLELLCSAVCCAAASDGSLVGAARVLEQSSEQTDAQCTIIEDAESLESAALDATEGTVTTLCLSKATEGSSCVSFLLCA